ncbi:MaoC/PaaZ C-terminal domain-containing protein [Agromyces bauzanensis]|uniref:MaoC family dehydratase n=1 Tax=Agromyces bauzanensis TaxID=1308924 RepID=A0A917UWP2_9MICO|nr:MaoC/PaaZ C-terminal domain-containing protein [Agromyces bauzanensis]GGJ91023.1 MaoC family dehydratase [Agromyces bauzanensis]
MSAHSALYLDDLHVGMSESSPARTVTEADVVMFAALSGDFNWLHTDAHRAAQSEFGERIAHGLLGTSIASGLFTRTAFSQSLQDSLVAMLGVDCKFERPIHIGDTLHVEAQIVSIRPGADGKRGIATIERRVINQHGERVQLLTTPMLIRRSIAGTQEVTAHDDSH